MLGLTLLLASFLGLQQPAPVAQAAAVLTGKVVDRSGGALPGVTVTLEAPAPAAPRSIVIASDKGEYQIDNIAPRTYTPAPPNRPMMNIIQGGINPAKRNEGFPAIPLERTSVTGIKHVVGVVSMARGTPDSATSDFFVLLDDQPSLDFGGLRFDDGQGGAAFGHVLSGLDVVKKIQQQPVDGQNLSGPVTIRRVWRLTSR